MDTISEYTQQDPMRDVELEGGYRLRIWETPNRAATGQTQVAYRFEHPEHGVIFEGAEYGVAPGTCIDSDDSLRGLMGFLTIRPGEDDRELFRDYTPEQLAWAEAHAESLVPYGIDPEEGEEDMRPGFRNLDDWDEYQE